jgi:hypothetical protein
VIITALAHCTNTLLVIITALTLCLPAGSAMHACMLLRAVLQGCGLVEYAQHTEAAAALQALGGRCVWRGAEGPMVVEWYREMPPPPARKTRAAWPGLVGQSSSGGLGFMMPPASGQHWQLPGTCRSCL